LHALRTIALQVLSHEAAYQVKQLGEENDLIARVRKDAYFDPIKDELDALLDPRSFIGRAPQQVDKFVNDWVVPALAAPELKAAVDIGDKAELSV
jgi:adenylosuccinate lyase